jgi:UDP-N-acetylmuramoyl-L-alanyl-D-glutamate--2,6-diaminopimelate ligase
MEVSSHALCLSRVYGLEYEIGVFTNLSPEHLDFHGTMEAYAQAKSLLFAASRRTVVNNDDPYAGKMIESAADIAVSYAIENSTADFMGKDVKLLADRVEFCLHTAGGDCRMQLQVPGRFSVYNALASIATTSLLGFDTEQIASALKSFEGVRGRAEVIAAGHGYTVLIDYAHTPDALKNIITAVRGFTQGRVVTLFGCGGDRDKAKRPLMGAISVELSDFTVITSDNPRTEEPREIIGDILTGIEHTNAAHKVIENRSKAICWALDNLTVGDVLILAGKGHETYQILGTEKLHFDDREVVAEHIRQIRVKSRK